MQKSRKMGEMKGWWVRGNEVRGGGVEIARQKGFGFERVYEGEGRMGEWCKGKVELVSKPKGLDCISVF